MEKLREKTFYTIFFIISSFMILILLFFNIQNYQKEYSGIENNLSKMNEIINGKNNKRPEAIKELPENNLNNQIIMDYNFYTLLLDEDNHILDKISHNENKLSEDIIKQAEEILSNTEEDTTKIPCLYFHKVAYRLKLGKFLILVDTSNVQQRLLSIGVLSMILLILSLSFIYYFSKKITDWITEPVKISFNKQKEFIANASHELKTPLAVMMASIDCLEVDKKNQKWLQNLKIESDRMNHLISRLLELSRSENTFNKETYIFQNLSKIIEKRSLTFESLAYEKGLEIETNIEKNIPFQCNPNDMDELVGIILDNAIKHSDPNCKIKVNLFKEKNHILLEIINTGEEIPTSECDKIFERFYRRDPSRNRNSNRYGLGLAIAKNIVSNHDGEIKAFSQNHQTTFRIIFKYKEQKS